jgi:hypothetical protein
MPSTANETWKKMTTPVTLRMSPEARAKNSKITFIPSMRESRRSGRSTRSSRSTDIFAYSSHRLTIDTSIMHRSITFHDESR